MKPNHSTRIFLKALIYVLIFGVSLLSVASNTALRTFTPQAFGNRNFQFLINSSKATTASGLVVDVYTDTAGRGQNVSIGTYQVGEQVKFYVEVSQNCSFTLNLVTPDGSVWNRMVAPISAGTFVDYVDAQYPTGTWKIEAIAQQSARTVTETAPFNVVERAPFTLTRTLSFNKSTIDEVIFDGKIVRDYLYSVGGVYAWDVLVGKVYLGPDIRNITVKVQLLAISYTPNYPPGFVDYSITLGDRVQVYGLLSQKQGQDMSVTLNGSEDYYIKKQSTLFESPEIVFFAREIFAANLTAKIDGVAIPGNESATVSDLSWNWGDGTSSSGDFPATHVYAKPGTYIIQVEAFQSDGLTAHKSISITVPENAYSAATQTTTSGSTIGQTMNQPVTFLENSPELWMGILLAAAIAIALAVIATKGVRTKKLDA